jgi:hypothetical protein
VIAVLVVVWGELQNFRRTIGYAEAAAFAAVSDERNGAATFFGWRCALLLNWRRHKKTLRDKPEQFAYQPGMWDSRL